MYLFESSATNSFNQVKPEVLNTGHRRVYEYHWRNALEKHIITPLITNDEQARKSTTNEKVVLSQQLAIEFWKCCVTSIVWELMEYKWSNILLYIQNNAKRFFGFS